MKFWVIKNKNGDLFACELKPNRIDGAWRCDGRIQFLGGGFIRYQFDNLTYESDPIEVELKVVER